MMSKHEKQTWQLGRAMGQDRSHTGRHDGTHAGVCDKQNLLCRQTWQLARKAERKHASQRGNPTSQTGSRQSRRSPPAPLSPLFTPTKVMGKWKWYLHVWNENQPRQDRLNLSEIDGLILSGCERNAGMRRTDERRSDVSADLADSK